MNSDALEQIRGLSDAALVSMYRATRLHRNGPTSMGVLRDALADEIRRRSHINFDGKFVHGYDSTDGFGTMPRRDDK